jgi:hypothetical protein
MRHPVLAPLGPSQGRRVFEANFRVYGVSKIWRADSCHSMNHEVRHSP